MDGGAARRDDKGRRRGLATLKGRQVDPAALAEVQAILGAESRQRDLLIEHLHRIQDRVGHLPERHLAALAHEMRLSMAEVWETVTFYARFRVVPDRAVEAPPALTVRVCESLSCAMAGAKVFDDLKIPGVQVERAPCMGRCAEAPAVEVGRGHVDRATPEAVREAVAASRIEPVLPSYVAFDDYVRGGGYLLLKECLGNEREAESVIAEVEKAGLRGMGGAGFPAGRKWRVVRAEPAPRLMALNADEGEPGTFKDRHFLESDPHRVLEGMLIAAWLVEATDVYIYLRDEYPAVREILRAELPRLRAAGLDSGTRIHLRRGAGAYICGEESAMLESIEGKRGWPRNKPPYPAQVGLFGRPTLVQNVETMFWVRDIVQKGSDWWRSHGRNGRTGLRAYSLSGRVRNPGVKIAPAGITVRELIDEFGGGMAEGHVFKGYLPGGASGGILPASKADVPLDFDTLQPHGCFIGSAAVIVLSDQDPIKDVVRNLMHFFADESCGQCTPCRSGTEKVLHFTSGLSPTWNRERLEELSRCMIDASICGLGQAAPNPLLSAYREFGEEVG